MSYTDSCLYNKLLLDRMISCVYDNVFTIKGGLTMNYKLNNDDLKKHLEDQLTLLRKACKDYDNDFDLAAVHMSSILRILLKDSLLDKLNIRNSVKYLSTVNNYTPTNLVSYFGLGYISVSGIEGSYRPRLEFFNENGNEKLLDFSDWWNEIVLANDNGSFSRRDVILGVSDKEGGAHVDDRVSLEQRKMIKENGLGWKVNEVDIISNVFYVSLRVISEELLWSINFYINSSFRTHFISPNQEIQRRTLSNSNVYFAYISHKMRDISQKIYSDTKTVKSEVVRGYIEQYSLRINPKGVKIFRIH